MYSVSEIDTSFYDAAWFDKSEVVDIYEDMGLEFTADDIPVIRQRILDALNSQDMAASRSRMRDLAWANRGLAAKLTADYMINS